MFSSLLSNRERQSDNGFDGGVFSVILTRLIRNAKSLLRCFSKNPKTEKKEKKTPYVNMEVLKQNKDGHGKEGLR